MTTRNGRIRVMARCGYVKCPRRVSIAHLNFELAKFYTEPAAWRERLMARMIRRPRRLRVVVAGVEYWVEAA